MPQLIEILEYPDPKLKRVSNPVTRFDAQLHRLLDDMAFTMRQARGIGLAAVQVGVPKRIFIVDLSLSDDADQQLYEVINPKLHDGQGRIVYEEGCLSVPGITEEVVRKQQIVVDYQDRNGKPKQLKAQGLLAVALQHENDHLDGIVFIDRVSMLKRHLIKRKLAKRVTL